MKKFLVFLATVVMSVGLIFSFTACQKKVLIGFDIELAQAVSEELGLELKFQEIDWDLKKAELDSKNIDVIWNGMSMLESRLSEYTFSTPYMDNKQVAVVRKADESKYTTMQSLTSANLVVEKGSTAQSIVDAENSIFSNTTVVKADSMIKAFTELMSSTSDVAIVDSTMAYSALILNESYGEKLMVTEIDFNSNIPYGIGMRLGSFGLKDKIDGALAKMWDNGTISALGEKYGVSEGLLNCSQGYVSNFDSLSSAQKADWDYIANKGTLIIGYTLFSPMAYFE